MKDRISDIELVSGNPFPTLPMTEGEAVGAYARRLLAAGKISAVLTSDEVRDFQKYRVALARAVEVKLPVVFLSDPVTRPDGTSVEVGDRPAPAPDDQRLKPIADAAAYIEKRRGGASVADAAT
jgi:hypothetical protein